MWTEMELNPLHRYTLFSFMSHFNFSTFQIITAKVLTEINYGGYILYQKTEVKSGYKHILNNFNLIIGFQMSLAFSF